MRVGLIGCGKDKLDRAAPAKELYTGPFFKLTKRWITHPGRVDEWGILSAKHGLVLPDEVVSPYDVTLSGMPRTKILKWAAMVHEQLMSRWGKEAIYMILAGASYKSAVFEMPQVEDVIQHWTDVRKARGMRRPHMSIGVIKKYIIEGRGFY